MHVGISLCLHICMCACVSVCALVFVDGRNAVHFLAHQPYMRACVHAEVHTPMHGMQACMEKCIDVCMRACMHACGSACMSALIYACMCSNMHGFSAFVHVGACGRLQVGRHGQPRARTKWKGQLIHAYVYSRFTCECIYIYIYRCI